RLNLNNSALLMQNPTAINNNNNGVPSLFRLYQNYPNPFNPSTVIAFDMPKDGYASLKVFNTLGQEVGVIIDGIIKAGSYQKVFNAAELPSGIYFYKFTTESFSDVRKMSLIK
ncbi:MAG: 5'-nucleotidase domain-containing protein, partial [Chlorobi bacterium OLB5]